MYPIFQLHTWRKSRTWYDGCTERLGLEWCLSRSLAPSHCRKENRMVTETDQVPRALSFAEARACLRRRTLLLRDDQGMNSNWPLALSPSDTCVGWQMQSEMKFFPSTMSVGIWLLTVWPFFAHCPSQHMRICCGLTKLIFPQHSFTDCSLTLCIDHCYALKFIWFWSSPENVIPVFLHKICLVERDSQMLANESGIIPVLVIGADSCFIHLIPVHHEDTMHIKTCSESENSNFDVGMPFWVEHQAMLQGSWAFKLSCERCVFAWT